MVNLTLCTGVFNPRSAIINKQCRKVQKLKKMSHNVYTDDNEITSKDLCNYLIKVENNQDWEEVIPCNNITTAIKIASEENHICRIYQKVCRSWIYMCDVSKGVI